MRYWIFQGHPNRYDVAKLFKPGQDEVWLASRYRDSMSPDDIVLFWRAGEESKRGLYGWGVITSNPTFHDNWGWGVPVHYEKRFPQHIPAESIRSSNRMESHLLFRMAAGTNFPLTDLQAESINQMIKANCGEAYMFPGGAL